MAMSGEPADSNADVMDGLIADERQFEKRDCEAGSRSTFFRSVSLRMPDGHWQPVLARDISPLGMGLLHSMHLAPGRVQVSISAPDERAVTVPMDIVWCQPCGEGWYISGGEFVETSAEYN